MELLIAGALVLSVDQATKSIVLKLVGEGQSVPVGSMIRLRLVTNRSAVLGYATSKSAVLALWVVTIVGLLVLVQNGPVFFDPVARIGIGCAFGGATGNFVDRLRRGGVVDFIDLGFWPVFNFADSAIVGGVGLALVFLR